MVWICEQQCNEYTVDKSKTQRKFKGYNKKMFAFFFWLMRTTEIEWDECCQFTNTKVELCELILTHTQCLQAMKPEQNEKKKKNKTTSVGDMTHAATLNHTYLVNWNNAVGNVCNIFVPNWSSRKLSGKSKWNKFLQWLFQEKKTLKRNHCLALKHRPKHCHSTTNVLIVLIYSNDRV